MNIEEFNYTLPEELIAQHPTDKRSDSRLLQLNPNTEEIIDNNFTNFLSLINQNDLLVFNDTKVIKASKGKIFCKSGAEGIFLFVDFQKEISGVIKIADGNERAIPIAILNIFKKFKVMSKVELKNLEKKEKFELKNHAGRNIGFINLTMK